MFFGFAGESDDDVRRDGTVRDAFADGGDQVAIVLLGVAAFHVFKHGIVTGLNGDFDVRHKLGHLGDGVHQFFAEVVGMRGQEADALDAIHFVDQAQQTGQVGAIGDVFAVAVYDLTQQGDFFDALRRQRADFGDDIAHGAAALDAALVGDDAVGAGVRAAVDDRNMRADQLPLLVDGQQQVAVHDFEAAGGFVGFEGADLALGEMRDERAGVGGRREDIYHG